MESFKGGLKGYWKRRGYHRIDGGGGGSQGRRRPARAELGGRGGSRRRRRWFWRIKISPRLGFLRAASPRRILARIRDAYVRMMLSFASAAPLGAAYGDYYGYGYGAYGGGAAALRPPLKEYDEKVLVEIYKKFIAATVSAGGASAGAIVLRS